MIQLGWDLNGCGLGLLAKPWWGSTWPGWHWSGVEPRHTQRCFRSHLQGLLHANTAESPSVLLVKGGRMVVADAVPTALGVFVVSGFCPDLLCWAVPSLQTLIC